MKLEINKIKEKVSSILLILMIISLAVIAPVFQISNVFADSDSNTFTVSFTTSGFYHPPSPTPIPNNGTSGYGMQLQISNINVIPDTNRADVSFTTNMPTRAKVFWGKTADYEAGSLSALVYGLSHEVEIGGLELETNYYLRIEATNSQGVTVSSESLFTTTSGIPVYPLANPSNFVTTPETDHINLTWMNPRDPRFDSVRIVRSETFFPKDQFDGIPVYEGIGEAFNDTNVTVGKTYYYAIFSKGKDGSFSSGALSRARIALAGEISIPTSYDPFANIPESQNIDPKIKGLTLGDFDFIQEGKTLTQVGGAVVAVNGSENLIVRLRYDKVPEVLKTIAITLTDPSDPSKVFPFLLRVNADKTYYEATLGPLGRTGNYAMSIVIMDYQNQGLKRIHGNLEALAFTAVSAGMNTGSYSFAFPIIFVGILLVLLLLLMMRRRQLVFIFNPIKHSNQDEK